MDNIFSFSVQETLTNDINENLLTTEILNSDISQDLMNFVKIDDQIHLVFNNNLAQSDLETLNTIIQAHQGFGIELTKTIEQNKDFADKMLQKMKGKNISEGLLSIDTAAWVHHRLRKADYVLGGGPTVQIDVLNLVISGDIETAEHVLGQMVPDNMTEEYHWMSQSRIDWIRNEIRTYLGWPIL